MRCWPSRVLNDCSVRQRPEYGMFWSCSSTTGYLPYCCCCYGLAYSNRYTNFWVFSLNSPANQRDISNQFSNIPPYTVHPWWDIDFSPDFHAYYFHWCKICALSHEISSVNLLCAIHFLLPLTLRILAIWNYYYTLKSVPSLFSTIETPCIVSAQRHQIGFQNYAVQVPVLGNKVQIKVRYQSYWLWFFGQEKT